MLQILLSMLFHLLLTCITSLLWFFPLFFVIFKNFFINPDVIENVRPQLAPIIPAGAPMTDTNDAIEILLATTDKKNNDLLKYSKEAIYFFAY